MKQFELAMYDWNGTLANDAQICYACSVSILEKFAPGANVPTMLEWRRLSTAANFMDYYYEHGMPRSVTIEHLREAWVPEYHNLLMQQKRILRHGADEVLRHFHGKSVPNVIVSSSIDDVPHFLTMANASNLFHTVNVGVPNKLVRLIETLEFHDVEPEQAFYIDDTYDGITHAKEARIVTVGILDGCTNEERVRAAKPDHIVYSFYDFLSLLNS